jgi:hypothetical protein
MHKQDAASVCSPFEVKTAHPIVCCFCCSRPTRLHSSDRPRSVHPPYDSLEISRFDANRSRDQREHMLDFRLAVAGSCI